VNFAEINKIEVDEEAKAEAQKGNTDFKEFGSKKPKLGPLNTGKLEILNG